MKKFITIFAVLSLIVSCLSSVSCSQNKYGNVVKDAAGEVEFMETMVKGMTNSTEEFVSTNDGLQIHYLRRLDEIEQNMQYIAEGILAAKHPSPDKLDIALDAAKVISKCGEVERNIISIASKNVISNYLVNHPDVALSCLYLMN